MSIDEQFKDIQDDISEMNKMYEQEGVDESVEEFKEEESKESGESEESEEPEEAKESEDSKEPEEPKGTEEPEGPTEPAESAVTEESSTESPATEAPKEELSLESLTEENRKLREKLSERLSAVDTKEPEKPAEVPTTPVDFIGDEDVDDLVRDKESFNKLLNQVYSKGISDTRTTLTEGVLRTIPDIVKTNVKVMTDLREASDKFYDTNKDLAPFKRVVSAVFEEVASSNPDKNYTELLDDVAKETRNRLELHHQAVSNTRDEDKPPTLPHKRTQRRAETKPNVSRLESEIAEMDKALT